MAELRATPMSNPIMGLLADRLKKAQQFGAKPFGYENPPVEMLMNLLGVPAVQQTMERIAYGEPLTTGSGMTTKPRAETVEAAMAVSPVAGLLGKATKGLPVGASIKPINIEKGIYKPELTMEEMLKVKDIPTVERVQKSLDLVGEKQFEKMVNDQFKKYKPSSPEQEAMLVESVTLQILGKAERSPYPQQEALKLAQERAALPVEQGGLGLPKDNTAMDRAAVMFPVDAYHGTNTADILSFDPSLMGKQSGGNLKASFFADRPSAANYYINETPENVVIKPQYAEEYNKIYSKFASDEAKAIEKFNETYDKKIRSTVQIPWDEKNPEIVALQKQARKSADEYFGKYFDENIVQNPKYFDKNPEGLVYPVKLNTEGFMDYDAGGATWTPYQDQRIKSILSQEGRTLDDVGGVNISNSYDADVGQKIGVYAVANPDNIRSRFAAFDPWRKTAAIAASMGVAAPDLLAQEAPQSLLADEEKIKLLRSLLDY